MKYLYEHKLFLVLILLLLVPFTVQAAMCEKKQANTKYKFCVKTKPDECFETNADFPDDLSAYTITEIRYCKDSGYELKDGTSSSISIGNNLKSNSTYYSLGCGPSNVEEYGWCK